MPIESAGGSASPDSSVSIGDAYLAEAGRTLQDSLAKIAHCFDQLRDEDLSWRAHESGNSIQNIILHLCGNLHQWIAGAIGGRPDARNRAQEFSERRPIAKAELASRLRVAVTEAVSVLAACPVGSLLEPLCVQGFDTNKLAAIFDSVSHFVGHTHQIVYITRLRLGDAYRFQWTPSKEHGG